MDNPRPEKVAVVDEVRERLTSANAALLTEYRGLDVGELARLPARCGRGRRVQDLQEHARALHGPRDSASTRLRTHPPAPADWPSRSWPTMPPAWRRRSTTSPAPTPTSSSRAACSAPRCSPPATRAALAELAVARPAARPAPRGDGRPAADVRRPAAGAAPQPGVRAAGPHRQARRRPRGGRPRARGRDARARAGSTEPDRHS